MLREKTALEQRFPLAWQGAGGNSPAWKIGRGSLASSHAGTRLPIAVFPARTQGAPPRPAPGRSPGRRCFVRCTSLLSQTKNGDTRVGARRKACNHFLRWHYPHQVKGRSDRFLSARSAPLFLQEDYIPIAGRLSSAAAVFRQNIPQTLANRGRAVYNFVVVNRGVCRRGLRGD